MFGMRRLVPVGALLAGIACGPKSGPPPAPPASQESEFDFENPGGMWMPSQMGEHAETLSKLGLTYEPKALTDPTAFPLGAVVSLGGCSASFVSPEGLIITNHHCVVGALQYNSTPEDNLLEHGFLAADRTQERPTGRSIYVTIGFTDVTTRVVEGLEAIEDPSARFFELEKRKRSIDKACDAKSPDTSCEVATYFEGAQYVEIEALEVKDVRLVYAPHKGIGVFGGEVDNWRWPRQTGDFAFLRAYVGSDGKPARPSADNKPFTPPHHLKVATEPLAVGDLAMVAGYPGRTYRLKTAEEVGDAIEWRYPKRIEKNNAYIRLYEEMAKGRPDIAIKAASKLRRLHNGRTNNQGMIDGLAKGGLADRKRELEKELQAWIAADPGRNKSYGHVLAGIAAASQEFREHRDHDAAVREILEASRLLAAAALVREAAKEREKPEEERSADFSGEGLAKTEKKVAEMSKTFDPELDRAVLRLAIVRAAALPEGQRPTAVFDAVLGKAAGGAFTEEEVDAALRKVYKRSKLGDDKRRLKIFRTATSKAVKRSRDPFLRLAGRLGELTADVATRRARYEGTMAALRPKYVAAVREFTKGPIAPDANGTLRVSFGTVRSYRPAPDAELHPPITTLASMIAKHTGEPPFAAPGNIIEAAKNATQTRYVDADLGDVPVNFLADLDITGGNSGSATLNAKGELIGVVFDGNYESIASDWVFISDITRSIHVDIRYVLWIMEHVDSAHSLMREMGVQPQTSANAQAAAG